MIATMTCRYTSADSFFRDLFYYSYLSVFVFSYFYLCTLFMRHVWTLITANGSAIL